MLIRSPYGKRVLLDARQVAEQAFRVLTLFVGVQLHVVYAGQPEHRQFVVLGKPCLNLELPVDEIGQKRQADHLEQQLQIRLADGEEIGGAPPHMPRRAQRHLRSTEGCLEIVALGIAVAQPYVEHRAERPALVGRESAGIELHFAYEVGIEYAHRAARGPLRGKVIDVGYLDAVEEKAVLRRRTAAHDEVVAIADGRKRHSGVRADNARYVAVAARALLYLAHADEMKAHRAYLVYAQRRGTDGDTGQHRCVFL